VEVVGGEVPRERSNVGGGSGGKDKGTCRASSMGVVAEGRPVFGGLFIMVILRLLLRKRLKGRAHPYT